MKVQWTVIGFLILNSMSSAAEPGVTDTEVVIGGHTAESGNMAIYSAIPRAASAYFDRLNASGGIYGRKIKYLRIDTQGEHLKSVQATKKLVEDDGVFASFLAIGASHQPVYKYLIEKGVPDIYPTDSLSEYGDPVKKTVFPGNPSFVSEGRAYGDLALEKHKGGKTCFLITDNTMGEEILKGAKGAIEEGNKTLPEKSRVKIGPTERVDRNATQANTQVLKLKKENCDVVITSMYSSLCPNAINFGATQGFKPAWMVLNWNASPKFIDLLPSDMKDGVVSSAVTALSADFNVPAWKDFSELMEKAGVPLARAQTGYTAAETFAEMLKRAGKNLTRESLIRSAESMKEWKCGLCLVPMHITADNHWAFRKPALIVSKGGKWLRL